MGSRTDFDSREYNTVPATSAEQEREATQRAISARRLLPRDSLTYHEGR